MEPRRDLLDEPAPPDRPMSLDRRLLVVALLALALAALAVGMGSEAQVAPGSEASLSPTLVLLPEVVGWVAAIAAAAFLVLLVLLLWPQRRRKNPEFEIVFERPPMHWALKLALTLLPVALLAGLVLAFVLLRNAGLPAGLGGNPSLSTPAPPSGPISGGAPTAGAAAAAGLPWWWAVAIALALVVGIALLLTIHRGARIAESPEGPPSAAQTVEETLDVLRREPDPRRAVIRAYAAMEASFRRRGFPRRRFETPSEYVRRVLGGLRARPDDVATLVALFTLARFSQHAIEESDRARAIRTLGAIREGLEG